MFVCGGMSGCVLSGVGVRLCVGRYGVCMSVRGGMGVCMCYGLMGKCGRDLHAQLASILANDTVSSSVLGNSRGKCSPTLTLPILPCRVHHPFKHRRQ